MLQQESRLRIVDNSGGRRAAIIRLSSTKSLALVRITKAYPLKKVKKGEIYSSCVVGLTFPQKRKTGVTFKTYSNDIIILKKDKTPLSTRVYRPVFIELRYSGLSRVCSIAKSVL